MNRDTDRDTGLQTAGGPAGSRWTEVYESRFRGHALLVAGMLEAMGLEVHLAERRTESSGVSLPLVQVPANQAARARKVLSNYSLSS